LISIEKGVAEGALDTEIPHTSQAQTTIYQEVLQPNPRKVLLSISSAQHFIQPSVRISIVLGFEWIRTPAAISTAFFPSLFLVPYSPYSIFDPSFLSSTIIASIP
jgi:hypothetical protein